MLYRKLDLFVGSKITHDRLTAQRSQLRQLQISHGQCGFGKEKFIEVVDVYNHRQQNETHNPADESPTADAPPAATATTFPQPRHKPSPFVCCIGRHHPETFCLRFPRLLTCAFTLCRSPIDSATTVIPSHPNNQCLTKKLLRKTFFFFVFLFLFLFLFPLTGPVLFCCLLHCIYSIEGWFLSTCAIDFPSSAEISLSSEQTTKTTHPAIHHADVTADRSNDIIMTSESCP